MTESGWEDSTEGAPQGSPLSPLLSNVVLDELDKELEKRQMEFCRFADDCNIFVKSQKAADRVMESVSKFIEKKLKLVVNKEKSKVAKSNEVKFLGMTIVNATIAISKKAMDQAMTKIKELTPRGTSQTLDQTITKINQWYRGWSEYFSMTQYPAQLGNIEAHTRRRLRSRWVSQQKNRRTLYKQLVKRGVSRARAANTAYSHQKKWALSHTKAVEQALSNAWFREIGLFIRSREYRGHWFELKRWVKLT